MTFGELIEAKDWSAEQWLSISGFVPKLDTAYKVGAAMIMALVSDSLELQLDYDRDVNEVAKDFFQKIHDLQGGKNE